MLNRLLFFGLTKRKVDLNIATERNGNMQLSGFIKRLFARMIHALL